MCVFSKIDGWVDGWMGFVFVLFFKLFLVASYDTNLTTLSLRTDLGREIRMLAVKSFRYRCCSVCLVTCSFQKKIKKNE